MKIVVHFINDSNLARGGAQKILNEISNSLKEQLIESQIYDFKRLGRKFGLSFFKNSIKAVVESKKYDSTVIIHSRCFLFLVPVLNTLRIKSVFVAHANYERGLFFFKLFKTKQYVAVSNSAASPLIKQGLKVDIIYNFVESSHVNSTQDIKHIYNFGYVGSLQPWKSIGWLLEAIHNSRVNKNFKLKVVGDGPLKAELLSRKNNFSCEFLGHRQEPYKFLQDTNVIIVPSQREGFGLVVLEALINGKSVICRDIEVFREITAGLHGVYFFGTDKEFSSLLNSPESLRLSENKIHSNRNKILKTYGKEVFKKRYVELIGNGEEM